MAVWPDQELGTFQLSANITKPMDWWHKLGPNKKCRRPNFSISSNESSTISCSFPDTWDSLNPSTWALHIRISVGSRQLSIIAVGRSPHVLCDSSPEKSLLLGCRSQRLLTMVIYLLIRLHLAIILVMPRLHIKSYQYLHTHTFICRLDI